MVIFHSCVSLSEGTYSLQVHDKEFSQFHPIIQHSVQGLFQNISRIPIKYQFISPANHTDVPCISQQKSRCSNIFPDFPWLFHSCPITFHGFPNIFYGFRLVFHSCPIVFHGFPWFSQGFPIAYRTPLVPRQGTRWQPRGQASIRVAAGAQGEARRACRQIGRWYLYPIGSPCMVYMLTFGVYWW